MGLTSVSNKVDGVAGWDKSVADVNNVDETFANARDLGYSRLNNTRISVIGQLGKYDEKDLYKVQVQSNGKLFINLRTGEAEKDKVLNLSKYDQELAKIKADLKEMGVKTDEEVIDTTPKTPLEKAEAAVAKMKEEREKAKAGLLDDIAKGMTIKVYMTKGNRTICIGDSTADKSSKEYAAMKSILSGDYKAKKGMYYIEVGAEKTPKTETPYVMQIKQGTKYVNDYLVTETKSEDSKNETISLTSSTSSSEQISSAYAMQIQAQRYDATTTMLSNAYTNLLSIRNKKTGAQKLFSNLINKSV
mgnify:CR=1 FL=1